MENLGVEMNFTELGKRKILITGHTGFKGSWMSLWLIASGADVAGYGLDPKTVWDNFVVADLKNKMKDYRADIRDKAKLSEVFANENPEIIFHLAAQPLVIDGYTNPQETFEINIQGTVNVLEEFRRSATAKLLVVITSDKVYKNKETVWGYRERDRLGGSDPYSASKSAVELVTSSYIKSFFSKPGSKKVVTVRAGNVIGGGDWSANRIVPDCIRALEKKENIIIRNPHAVRPWQHVLEPIGGYLMLAEKILQGDWELDDSWNFGPDYKNNICVEEIVKKVVSQYGEGGYEILSSSNGIKESNLLMLDISKAAAKLKWVPVLSINESISLTVEWYKNYRSKCMYEFCLDQINSYSEQWSLLNKR